VLVLDKLKNNLRSAAIHYSDIQVSPSCILWPDGDRQWETIVQRLKTELPEMFVFGEYDVAEKTGPAIWLRCVIANKAPGVTVPVEYPPIIYLPGVSRQDLRAVESCPDRLRPLAELQYSGTIWSQINSKDWTILAFLKSDQGGLGLDVAQDNDAKKAMQLALNELMGEEIDILRNKHMDKDYFNMLLTSDPVRDLLQWLDQGDVFKDSRDNNAWQGFVEVCKSQLAFNPDDDGNLKGAELLAVHKGSWLPVWERFCESPKRYRNIPNLIRQCQMPMTELFSSAETHGGWPQWNDSQEKALSVDLIKLNELPPHTARERIKYLEERHKERRSLVWAELDDAPLACAMKSLSILAHVTASSLAAGTVDDLAAGYSSSSWQADDAVLGALAKVTVLKDIEAVTVAVRAVYLPWAEESARYLQKLVEKGGYPGKRKLSTGPVQKKPGECFFFIDGLRFDVGRRLAERLISKGLTAEEIPVWGAIPTVTATGKPAVTPVSHLITGQEVAPDFEPCVAATGKSLKGGYHLSKLFASENWQVLDKSQVGDPGGYAWCEFSNIDHEGHERGWKLAKYIETLLDEIIDRIEQLLRSGWKTIHIVTDHGWLLMPGGLPKTELPSFLTENKWGRCASLKPGAATEECLYPWFWNPHQEFALANGISCYSAKKEYAHGGISLQECLTLRITVSKGTKAATGPAIIISDVVWKGLRCKVAIEGEASGLSLDLRTHPGNAATSIVMGIKPIKEDGTSSVVVEDEGLEGQELMVVVIDEDERLVAQRETIIGKEN